MFNTPLGLSKIDTIIVYCAEQLLVGQRLSIYNLTDKNRMIARTATRCDLAFQIGNAVIYNWAARHSGIPF
jgi:hypothetical protein